MECPNTGAVMYVGQTSDFKTRRSCHLSGNMPSKRLLNWFDSLNGKRPVFRIVYITDDKAKKDELERKFIEVFAETVLNVRSGGLNSKLWREAYKREYFLSKV